MGLIHWQLSCSKRSLSPRRLLNSFTHVSNRFAGRTCRRLLLALALVLFTRAGFLRSGQDPAVLDPNFADLTLRAQRPDWVAVYTKHESSRVSRTKRAAVR